MSQRPSPHSALAVKVILSRRGRPMTWACFVLAGLIVSGVSQGQVEDPDGNRPANVKEKAKPTGILVFDNCDDQYQGKQEYDDNLTLLDSAGEQMFRVSGFNNCESIGSSRMIATDPARECVWVIENVAQRIRRFDLAGDVSLTISGVQGSAIAVDPETGNVWALTGATIGQGKLVVYDDTGETVAQLGGVSGWDIVYDRNSEAFWIAEKNLTKINAEDRKVVFSAEVSKFCASSADVDPRTGAVWVAVRKHPQVAGSSNQLFSFDADGNQLAAIDLGAKTPFRVSVDPKDGSVWVAHLRKSVERFSADGKSEAEYPVAALAVQVDPAGDDVWVVTHTQVQKMTSKGDVTKRVSHAGNTSQAWIVSLDYEGAPTRAEFISRLRERLAVQRGKLPADDRVIATTLGQLGRNLLHVRQPEEAEGPLRECLAIREKENRDSQMTFDARSMLGAALVDQKKYDQAEPVLLSAGYQGLKALDDPVAPTAKARLTETIQRIVDLYTATGRLEKAEKWRAKLPAAPGPAAEPKP